MQHVVGVQNLEPLHMVCLLSRRLIWGQSRTPEIGNEDETGNSKMTKPIEKQPSNGGVPIKFFLTEDMLPDDATISQLETLANTPGMDHHVAVLPDVHRKSRNVSPTGTAAASKTMIVPRAVDCGVCCGMRMFRTDLNAKEFTPSVLDKLFGEVMASTPVALHENETLKNEDVYEILIEGGKWSQKRFGLSDDELSRIEDFGTMPTDTTEAARILETLPYKSIKKGRKSLGTIGDGNHFLELQEIIDVFDEEAAELLGLQKGQAVFMMHTGSRGVGSKMMKGFLKEFEETLRQESPNNGESPIWALPADSEMGTRYARAVSAVSNFGFANRIAITENVRAAARTAFGDDSLKLPLLYDCAHVSIKRETWNGEPTWIHRHGTSRALPASMMADHPVFSKTGQPLPIPGSMGHASFIGVADEAAVDAFCSVNHGAGRVMDKPEASEHFTEGQVEGELRDKNIRLYRYGTDNIAEQAPNSFKDISKVIDAMRELRLAKPVVKVRPMAVLKG